MGDMRLPVEKFNGIDYDFWRIQIEDYLYGKDLHLRLGENKPNVMKEEEYKLLDQKAMSVVHLLLSKSIALYTVKAKSTKEMLKTLSEMHEKSLATNKVHFMRKLFNLEWQRVIRWSSISIISM